MSNVVTYNPPADDIPFPTGRTVVYNDPQNANYPAMSLMSTAVYEPDRTYRLWYTGDIYSQKGPSCVPNTAVGVMRAWPNKPKFIQYWPEYDTNDERSFGFYTQCQAVDPWHDHPHEGSSTDAPFRVWRNEGRIAGWAHLNSPEEVRDFVLHVGPVATGTPWMREMFYPSSNNGYLDGGSFDDVGGHDWRIIGWSSARDAFRMTSTWGRGWGEQGRAWCPMGLYRELWNRDSDAVVPVWT